MTIRSVEWEHLGKLDTGVERNLTIRTLKELAKAPKVTAGESVE